jgi:serine protease Do
MKNGQLVLDLDKIKAFLAKWDRIPPTDQPLDVLRFHRLFEDRLIAGDREVLGLIKDGKMMLTPAQMHALMEKWERQSPPQAGPGPKPGLADRLPPPTVKVPKNGAPWASLLQGLGLAGGEGDLKLGKASRSVLAALGPALSGAAPGTAVVLCRGKPVALGAVVRKDGYILTKASQLTDNVTCKIAGRELPAKVAAKRDDFDLALLQVAASDLSPVNWADGDPPRTGTWLAVPGAEGKPLALGIVGIAARPIPKAPILLLRNAAAIGVQLGPAAAEARVAGVMPGSPAAEAGLKAGDVIVAVNGKAAATVTEVRDLLGSFKPGDQIVLDVKRGAEKWQMTVVLGSAGHMAMPPGEMTAHKLDFFSSLGGTISKRKTNFPLALTHDAVIQAAQCGGPLVDLDGRAVGLNVARADRTATYAIPAGKLKLLLAEMLPRP